jgi:two-component system, OmpR family, response regulator
MPGLALLDGREARVLVVDHDEQVGELMLAALQFGGFVAARESSGEAALRRIDGFKPEIVVLDAALPDIDGFEVVRWSRRNGHRFPAVFLLAREEATQMLTGLLLDGDDYVAKPFGVGEVIARVHIMLRHTRGDKEGEKLLTYADLSINEEAHQVRRAGTPVELSPTEYRLLRYLMRNAGRVVSKAQILDHVWQYDFGGNAAVVEKFISTLRRKVDFVDPPLLHTVRGFGYMLRTPSVDGPV